MPRTLILGHRGSPLEAVENTLASLDLAIRRGADGVELDVQRTRDGVPVVIHDDTLDRTTSGAGSVTALSWAAIQRLTGASVPSLEQVAAWAAASGAWLNVEIKAAGVEKEVVELLRRMQLTERTIVSSFLPPVVSAVGELASDLPRFLLTETWEASVSATVREIGAEGVCLRDDAATPEALRELRTRDLPVIVWTVNDRARVRALLAVAVRGIITDHPAAAVAERADFERSDGSALAPGCSD
jgi:glycerophosphoryl diester phosphodiesterase